MKIKVINGPNLNMLGQRESHLYGDFTLAELEKFLREKKQQNTELLFFQSNHEGALIEAIHSSSQEKIDAIIINAASLTHSSIGLRDALLAVNIRFIEVHISNVHAREEFRHTSFLADKAVGVICGLGKHSYLSALQYFEQNF